MNITTNHTELEEAKRMEAFLQSPIASYFENAVGVDGTEHTTLALFAHKNYPHTPYLSVIARAQGRNPHIYTFGKVEEIPLFVNTLLEDRDIDDIDPWLLLPEIGGYERHLLGRRNGADAQITADAANNTYLNVLDKIVIMTAQPPQVIRRMPNPNEEERKTNPYVFATIFQPSEESPDEAMST